MRTARERFWAKVDIYFGLNGCWHWTGAKNRDGYGSFGHLPQRTMLAHRFSWELHNGEIPNGLYVLHTCDTPVCVNPSHLFLGTQKDNVTDCARKGRRNQARYGRHAGKLSMEQRLEVKRLRADTDLTQEEIGDMFGVRPQTVAYWERQSL